MSSTPLQVIYVSTTRDKGVRRNGASMSLAREEAILKDTGALAARYDVDVTTTLRANTAPEEAILQEIKNSGADLVVMGVDRIQGDALNFGSVAAAVLRKSKVSVLLVSLPKEKIEMPHPALAPNNVAVITGGASGIGLRGGDAVRASRLAGLHRRCRSGQAFASRGDIEPKRHPAAQPA